MGWQIYVNGEALDIQELRTVAPLCGCTIETDQNGRSYLSGSRFERHSAVEEVRGEASDVLDLLNGFAKIRHLNHRLVRLEDAIGRLHPDGRREISVSLHDTNRVRDSFVATLTGTNGTVGNAVSSETPSDQLKKVIGDPKLEEIAQCFGSELSWQRLRVVFEKIGALIGKRVKGNENALVKARYASKDEIDRFKANVEDPRHSGIDAVHGIPQAGPLKGSKMTLTEGHEFVVRLFTDYLGRSPTPPG